MPEAGRIGGNAISIDLRQQNKIEGAERNVERQEGRNSINQAVEINPNAGNRALTAAPERVEKNTEEIRASAENNVQQQVENLNRANNVADTLQTERGQNINEFV